MCVRWETSLSESFLVTNGVRQGGVLSPILFTVYMDDLLNDLKNLGIGCFWDSLYAGAFCYADDLVLLAPTPSALRIMISLCEEFARKRGLKFNASKTQLIRFSRYPSSNCKARIFVCNQVIPIVDTVIHLGHVLQYNLCDGPDITCRLRDIWSGRQTAYYYLLLLWDLIYRLGYFVRTACLFMARVCGSSPLRHSATLKLPLIKY